MRVVATSRSPAPNGHYSQAIVHGGMVYLSNQLPLVPGTQTIPASFTDQVRQVIVNCAAILEEAGSSLESVVTASIQISDIDDWKGLDDVWAQAFGSHRPARSVSMIGALHFGARIGVQMTAFCKR